jgi:hypothetical protein
MTKTTKAVLEQLFQALVSFTIDASVLWGFWRMVVRPLWGGPPLAWIQAMLTIIMLSTLAQIGRRYFLHPPRTGW